MASGLWEIIRWGPQGLDGGCGETTPSTHTRACPWALFLASLASLSEAL